MPGAVLDAKRAVLDAAPAELRAASVTRCCTRGAESQVQDARSQAPCSATP